MMLPQNRHHSTKPKCCFQYTVVRGDLWQVTRVLCCRHGEYDCKGLLWG